MGLQGAIRTLLKANGTITNLVGDRIRPLYGATLDKHPFITIEINSNQGGVTHSGASGSKYATVEIGILTSTYADAEALAAAIVDTLNGYVGTVGSIRICPAEFEDESDIPQSLQPGTPKPTYLKTVSFKVRYQLAQA